MQLHGNLVGKVNSIGYGTEITDDENSAIVRIHAYTEGGINFDPVILTGRPQDLRKFARFILDGLRKHKK